MKKIWKRSIAVLFAACLTFCLMACGGGSGTDSSSGSVDTSAVANDYYIDLSEMGMKLTIYLRLDAEGNFIFSNTPQFEVNKSSGTYQEADGEYVMVYTSVNGEEKSISEGITSSFVVTEDGSLDFSGCDRIHYGSAGATTVSEEDSSIFLMAHVITEAYEAPSTESSFNPGSYVAELVEKDGVYYTHVISFYEDNTYLHFVSYTQNGQQMFMSETGTYGVSTTQLALGLEHGDRIECEVVDDSNLNVSVLPYAGATERISMDFTKSDMISMLGSYSGTGSVKGSTDTFEASLTIYEDGSYDITAEGFTESGILVVNSSDSYMKQYPDHPETGMRGLAQVATVPSGTITNNNRVTITDLRVRTSDSLTRYACIVTE